VTKKARELGGRTSTTSKIAPSAFLDALREALGAAVCSMAAVNATIAALSGTAVHAEATGWFGTAVHAEATGGLFVIWCALGAGARVGFFVRDVMTMID
jgi:hypothetical protein